ncbi:MAG: Dna2/Cas4 domain-containing protein [Methanomicrobiales archaeon]|nr:Dna2/Cas4 domain-containing protein [Methanomicrobiales archaeon]
MEPRVRVSQILSAHFCPVRFYLERDSPRAESPRYTVCKQLSSHLGRPLDANMIWDEIRTVSPGIEPAMRLFLDTCVERCRDAGWPRPSEVDVSVFSDRLGIRGRVDKIFEDAPPFAITRSSEAPPAGVHGADRIRVAAYAACVAETLGIETGSGLVEYIPSGALRTCTIQPGDRRGMLRSLAAARRVMAGQIPRKPRRAPCTGCVQRERCTPTGTSLSGLLRE